MNICKNYDCTTLHDSIQDTTVCTQRGNKKIEYENRLFRCYNSNKPHVKHDGTISFYCMCCNSSCRGRLTIRCIGSLDYQEVETISISMGRFH